MTVRILHAIISVGEAAEIVGVSPDTMRDLIVRDQARWPIERFIPSARNMGRDWAMLRTEVEDFAKIDRRPGRPPAIKPLKRTLRRTMKVPRP
jgi:hypothetical protein